MAKNLHISLPTITPTIMKPLYQTMFYRVSLLIFNSLCFAVAQEDTLGSTATQPGVGGAAIIPTASGQIGVNPVTVLPDPDIL